MSTKCTLVHKILLGFGVGPTLCTIDTHMAIFTSDNKTSVFDFHTT